MTDEYVVVVTADESLVNDIQNATTMDVIHVSNHDTASENNYRRKIVILDPDTVETTQQDLSLWHENAHYLIVLLTNQDNDFIEQNQKYISDVWLKPMNSVLLKHRIIYIQQYLRMNSTLKTIATLSGAEVNSPLASIAGYVDVLLSGMTGDLTEQQETFILTIKSNGHKVRSIFSQIQSYAAFESENPLTYLREVNLLEMVNELRNQYGVEIVAPQNLPLIQVDYTRLDRVFHSLVSLAHPLPTLRLEHANNRIEVSVSSEDEFVAVTERGFYLHSSFFESQIIKHIIEQHGGEIFIETSPETGSTFHFTIPIAKEIDD